MASGPSKAWTWIVISCAMVLAAVFGAFTIYYIATSHLGTRGWWVLLRSGIFIFACSAVVRDRLRFVSDKTSRRKSARRNPRLPPLT